MRTNEFSKKCFFESLLKISKIKDYNDIDISEICTDAGYNRSTFYRIFKSKDELLLDGINNYALEYFKKIPYNAKYSKDYIENSIKLFDFIKQDHSLFVLMHKAHLEYKLYEIVKDIFPLPNDYGINHSYYVSFQANGLLALIFEWIDNGMQETPEFMGNLLAEIVENSSIYQKQQI